MMTQRPAAPALAHSAASARILSVGWGTESWSLSNTQALRCFQIIRQERRGGERPLCMGLGLGVACLAVNHQSLRESLLSSVLHVIWSQESVSCLSDYLSLSAFFKLYLCIWRSFRYMHSLFSHSRMYLGSTWANGPPSFSLQILESWCLLACVYCRRQCVTQIIRK